MSQQNIIAESNISSFEGEDIDLIFKSGTFGQGIYPECIDMNNNSSEDTKFTSHKLKYDRKKDQDNKVKKIKGHFFKRFTNLINKRIKELLKKSKKFSKMKNFILLRVDSYIYTNPNKKNNFQHLEPIKNIYLNPIAKKYKGYSSEHNIKMIETLEKEKEFKEINDALNLTYLDIFRIFRGEENDTGIEFLNELIIEYNEFIEEIEGKEGNSKEYIEGIIDTVKNFEHYFK